MAVKDKLAKLLDDAYKELHSIEGAAVSEVNRVEDAILAAIGAARTMNAPEPAPKAKSSEDE